VKHYNLYFGQAYGEGNYGEGSYSCTEQQQADGECTVAAGGGTSSGGSGGLADTGMAVLIFVTLACLIIFVSLIVRIWRRKPALQPVLVDEEPEIQRPQEASPDETSEAKRVD
jgi:hypothetical protein